MNQAPSFSLVFPPGEDETLDDLLIHGMKLLQSQSGYRFSLDPVLLAMWVSLKKVSRSMDLGTGNGVIALLLAARDHALQSDGLELQNSFFLRAQRNAANNGLQERMQILQGDIRQVSTQLPPHTYDLVVSNPPFFRVGEGIVNAHPEKAAARHELHVTLADVVAAAHHLLTAQGKFTIILNAVRLTELTSLLEKQGFALSRLRFVHSREGTPATMLLAEAVKAKKAALTVEPPLVVYQADGSYAPEIRAWYGMS